MQYSENKIMGINSILVKTNVYEVSFLDIGAAINSLKTINKNNVMEEIVLSYQNINEYKKYGLYLGANIGRFSGRIENGELTISNNIIHLDKNDNNINSIHGTKNGLHNKNMKYKIKSNNSQIIIEFFGVLFEKYDLIPGDLKVIIRYICEEDKIRIEYEASSNKDTICNLTNHSYFNLSGNNKENIFNQYLQGNIFKKWNTNSQSIPVDFENINYFEKSYKLGDLIKLQDKQTLKNNGIDNPFEFTGDIVLEDKDEGRKITFSSSYPIVVIYTQGFINNQKLNFAKKFGTNQGIALEFQNMPNKYGRGGSNSFLRKNNIFKEFIQWKFN